MMKPRSAAAPTPPQRGDAGRDSGPMVASRLIAVLRTGRSYAIGNPVFTAQLEQLLDVLAPVLRDEAEARVTLVQDELLFNGQPVGSRMANVRHAEQLAHEMLVREITGVRFLDGLTLPELEMFMRYFVPSEVHSGAELVRACAAQGVCHALPLLAGQEAPETPDEDDGGTPEAYTHAVETCSTLLREARALLGRGLPRGVESHHYKRLLQPVVDAAFAGQPISAGLADLDEGGIGPWVHGVRVSVLVAGVAHRLGLHRRTVAELAAAALIEATHDAGLTRLSGEARAVARRSSLSRLAHRTSLDPVSLLAMRLPFEGEANAPVTLSAQVVRAACAYVTHASSRSAGATRWTPYEALGLVLADANAYHAAVKLALAQTLGVYPPGQIVEFDDGTVARVCAAWPGDPERPLVERMTGPAGARTTHTVRTVVIALPAQRRIARAVPFARGTQAA